ncbi:MAG: hypothetical protein BMS9Abin13_218 [Patescibacteria group bacterium]|nr:MAG: hypothetical protein BMS9Abin13_218 [Patescibacteria group bacterium]
MDPEAKKLIEKNLELSKENNKMLRKMRRAMRWGKVFKLFYWTIIIGSTVGAYYYIQPFVDDLKATYGSFTSGVEKVQSIGDSLPDLDSLLRK